MRFDIITIFPNIFHSYFQESILKRAQTLKKVQIHIHDLRDFTYDKHLTVDDRPYGGGAGMVLLAMPMIRAIFAIKSKRGRSRLFMGHGAGVPKDKQDLPHVILLSAKGTRYNQDTARRLLRYQHIILICGRYEGVDERVVNFVDEEISIGDYVLTGGEIPAMVLVDSLSRLVPGVLGSEQSLQEESFSGSGMMGEYPHFTRPDTLKLIKKYERIIVRKKQSLVPWIVPEVLLSGHHQKIKAWRDKHCCKGGKE